MSEQPLLPFDEPEPRPAAPRADAAAPPALLAALAAECRARPLEEKVLVAPSLAIAYTLVERLAREDGPWVHLRVETVRTLALGIAAPALAREGRRLLSRAQALALVEQACARTLGPESYFGALRGRPGLHRAMQRTLDELRQAGIGPRRIPASAFADPRKGREIRRVLEAYAADLEAGGYVDGLDVLARAARERPGGDEATYLLPADLELSEIERRLLDSIAGDRLRVLPVDDPKTWVAQASGATLLRAIGEENEIREVFRRTLSDGTPFDDVEILHTDDAVYPSLLWELSREHDVPCTFAGGVSVTYSRPGQAALAFLDWIREDFAAERLRESLASGALTLKILDPGPGAPGARAVARALRQARVGWGRGRYAGVIGRRVRDLESPDLPSRRDDAELELSAEERSAARARRLAATRLAGAFTSRALALAPPAGGPDALRDLARGAGTFVADFARVIDDLDAAARTGLEALFREIAELPSIDVRLDDAIDRLRDAVRELAVMADRPRPGRVHVAFFRNGGYSGRRHTFLLGLDDARHPGRDLEDPVLLDEERRRINDSLDGPRLALERERPREQARALQACVARLRGSLVASYSRFDLRNLSQAGEPAPSPFFLELYREATGRTDADYRSMLADLPEARGFVPDAASALDDTEWWLCRLKAASREFGPGAAAPLVRAAHPWLEDGRAAEEARASDELTFWDGRVKGPVPELDPRRSGLPISASRIQELAQCPFAFFVRRVLRVEPPDDLERDPSRWLEPMHEGSLLHEVFRTFLERLTERGCKPDADRDLETILSIAAERIAAWRDRVPPSSEVAFEAQREGILQACRTFLAAETKHCREVTPRWFEVGFGVRDAAEDAIASAEPVEIALPRGERMRLRGSIDRVDEGPAGAFQIWDYKTGSAAGIQEGRGLDGLRQAQPALYALALEALLRRRHLPGSVTRSGYFFPGRKGEGQRVALPVDAEETGRALSRLFDLTGAGFFPHATSRDGCKFCVVEEVCGGPAEASAASLRKLAASLDPAVAGFRELHGLDD